MYIQPIICTAQKCLQPIALDRLHLECNHGDQNLCQSWLFPDLLSPLHSIIWSKEPPHPGGVSYLLCSPIKNREEEDPPWRTTPKIDQFWGSFWRGGPLPPGSWSGNIVNRNPPRGGGFFRSNFTAYCTWSVITLSDVTYEWVISCTNSPCHITHWVATIRRLLKIISLLCRISSLL